MEPSAAPSDAPETAAKYAGADELKAIFTEYGKELDSVNEKRERIVRASRDITRESKKLIFALHRANATNKERVIKKVEKEHNRVTDLIATRIASEVDVVEAPRYRRSFSPCLQEYVEASLMLHFMKTGQLLSREELESTIKLSCEKAEVPPLKLEVSDYILGAGDIAGELNRIVISVSAGGDLKYALEIRDFLRRFKIVLDAVPFHKRDHRIAKDLNTKKNTLQSSIAKIEKACFDLVVRRAEFPTSTPKSKKRPNADVIDEAAERSKRTRVNESN